MTTLVYAEKNNVGYLACDSQCTIGMTAENTPVNKAVTVNVNGICVVLTSGEARFISIWKDLADDFAESVASFEAANMEIEATDSARIYNSLQDDFVGYVKNNIPEVIKYFEEVNGVQMSSHQDGGAKGLCGSFFMASEKHGCFMVDSCLSMDRVTTFSAAGSGGVFATGVLSVLYPEVNTPDELEVIVMKAVETAKKLDPFSGGETRLFRFDMSNARSLEELNHVEITDELRAFVAAKALLAKKEEENADAEEE